MKKHKVLRIDLAAELSIEQAIEEMCDSQSRDGYELVSSVIWEDSATLVLIFRQTNGTL